MVAKILNIRPINLTINTLIILIAGLVVFTPNLLFLKWGASYAVHIMFSYLFLGFVFLMFKQSRMMFTSFACCAGLCLFLKNSSNTDIVYPAPSGDPVVNIAHFNISATNQDVESTIRTMKEAKADVLSIQEITPDWGMAIKESFREIYPYSTTVYRPEDFMGLAVYSKYPFANIDTFYHRDIPNLDITIGESNEKLHFISSYIYPELKSTDYERTKGHFSTMIDYISKIDEPIITFGELNQVQWSSYIKEMKGQNDLQDSRRFPFFDNPTDHIFYSSHFECIDFTTISNAYSNHLGIKGAYQFNMNNPNAKKASIKF